VEPDRCREVGVGKERAPLSFLVSSCSVFKGDSYPELCAQRTDEGGGFIWLRVGERRISLVRRGPLLGWFLYFFSFGYISLRRKLRFIHVGELPRSGCQLLPPSENCERMASADG
jgi:hypothetical protein